MMRDAVTTAAACRPVHLDQAKLHLRVDADDEDALIASLVHAATDQVEYDTGRALVCQTRTLTLDRFPAGDVIIIPRPPLIEVVSVQYVDSAGTLQTVDAADYETDTAEEPGRLYPAYGESWPSHRGAPDAVLVTYRAGYATPVTVAQSTEVWTAAGRSLTDAAIIRLSNSGGALPAPMAADTDYHVRDASGATFKLAAAAAGAAIDVTDAGTGTHFIGQVPPALVQAILLLAGHWYAHREAVVLGGSPTLLPAAVDRLTALYRTWYVPERQ